MPCLDMKEGDPFCRFERCRRSGQKCRLLLGTPHLSLRLMPGSEQIIDRLHWIEGNIRDLNKNS